MPGMPAYLVAGACSAAKSLTQVGQHAWRARVFGGKRLQRGVHVHVGGRRGSAWQRRLQCLRSRPAAWAAVAANGALNLAGARRVGLCMHTNGAVVRGATRDGLGLELQHPFVVARDACSTAGGRRATRLQARQGCGGWPGRVGSKEWLATERLQQRRPPKAATAHAAAATANLCHLSSRCLAAKQGQATTTTIAPTIATMRHQRGRCLAA
eukprot:355909-Chlamydomonas_euryale.AAC.2